MTPNSEPLAGDSEVVAAAVGVEAGVDGDGGVSAGGYRQKGGAAAVAAAGEAMSWLPEEAGRGEEPTLAGLLGWGFAGGTEAACRWVPGT